MKHPASSGQYLEVMSVKEKPDLGQRVFGAINRLDIDFSRFTLAGWGVTIFALCLGAVSASFAYVYVSNLNRWDRGAGLAFFFMMVAVTTITFNSCRYLLNTIDIPILKVRRNEGDKHLDS